MKVAITLFVFLAIASPVAALAAAESVEQGVVDGNSNINNGAVAVEAVPLAQGRERQPDRHESQVLSSAESNSLIRQVMLNLFSYSRIKVVGNYYVSDDDILVAAGVNAPLWIWRYDLNNIKERLIAYSWIKEVELKWSIFPLSLMVIVVEEKPWLVAELREDSWLVSTNGKLLQPLRTIKDAELVVDTVALPRLGGLTARNANETSQRLKLSLDTLRVYQLALGFPFEVERFTYLEDNNLELTPRRHNRFPTVLIRSGSFDEAKAALNNLATVLKDTALRNERLDRVDLRFSGQAVIHRSQSTTG